MRQHISWDSKGRTEAKVKESAALQQSQQALTKDRIPPGVPESFMPGKHKIIMFLKKWVVSSAGRAPDS